MASGPQMYDYVAVDPAGRRVKGAVAAASDGSAFEQLKRQGFAPLKIKPARGDATAAKSRSLPERDAASLLSDIGVLIRAGSDLRTAFGVIGSKAERPQLRAACRSLAAEIGGGGALEPAFARALGPKLAFVPAVIAAGESAGDLAGGFERSAQLLESKLRLRDQLISALSYPAFIFATSIVALAIILLFVIPALAPLVDQPGVHPPLQMVVLIGTSNLLRSHAPILAAIVMATIALLLLSARTGGLSHLWDRMTLHGPFRRTASALVFGGFAISLGQMLAAGTPMADALRLAARSVRSPAARRRIEPVSQAVRQGARLSDALAAVRGMPQSIIRLSAIGEASGSLGATLSRAGKLEEDAALRRIEAYGRMIGPLLIVLLGGVIGLMMGGLLSGITQLGDSALQ